MANGKGWLDCIDCVNCEWTRDPWKRYCNEYKLLLPSLEKLQYKHTVCSKFIVGGSLSPKLNSEVVVENENAIYYIYRRTSPHHNSEKPIHLEHNILYAFDYNEQVLRPFLNLT